MGTPSQAWTQDNLQHTPTTQSGKAASQDDRGQGWAQTYLELSSCSAWVPGHEFKGGFMGSLAQDALLGSPVRLARVPKAHCQI